MTRRQKTHRPSPAFPEPASAAPWPANSFFQIVDHELIHWLARYHQADPIGGNSTTFCMDFNSSGTLGSLRPVEPPLSRMVVRTSSRDQRLLVNHRIRAPRDRHAARSDRLQLSALIIFADSGAARHITIIVGPPLRTSPSGLHSACTTPPRTDWASDSNRDARGSRPASDRLSDPSQCRRSRRLRSRA